MSTLADYLTRTGTTQENFALRVGARQATISRLANRTIRPSLELAVAIERETKGEVPASSWIEPASGAAA